MTRIILAATVLVVSTGAPLYAGVTFSKEVVRVLQEHKPVLTVFVLAAGVPTDPGLRIGQASADQMALIWNGSAIYPLDRPRFQESSTLQNWNLVPSSALTRILFQGGVGWRVSHQQGPQYFIRLAAELVP